MKYAPALTLFLGGFFLSYPAFSGKFHLEGELHPCSKAFFIRSHLKDILGALSDEKESENQKQAFVILKEMLTKPQYSSLKQQKEVFAAFAQIAKTPAHPKHDQTILMFLNSKNELQKHFGEKALELKRAHLRSKIPRLRNIIPVFGRVPLVLCPPAENTLTEKQLDVSQPEP